MGIVVVQIAATAIAKNFHRDHRSAMTAMISGGRKESKGRAILVPGHMILTGNFAPLEDRRDRMYIGRQG